MKKFISALLFFVGLLVLTAYDEPSNLHFIIQGVVGVLLMIVGVLLHRENEGE